MLWPLRLSLCILDYFRHIVPLRNAIEAKGDSQMQRGKLSPCQQFCDFLKAWQQSGVLTAKV